MGIEPQKSRSRFEWRPLEARELDHEALWLGVTSACAVGGWLWLHWSLPVPPCAFHRLTGIPCPACGATRAMRQLSAGHLQAAAHFNPLAVLAACLVIAFDLYALVVLFLRLPRLRVGSIAAAEANAFRVAIFLAVAVNWAWLIRNGI